MKHWISSLLLTGIFLLCAGCAGPAAPGQEEPASLQFFAMDTVMSVTAYGEQGQTGVQAARDAVNRLDGLLSRTDSDSQIARLNTAAGDGAAVAVDPDGHLMGAFGVALLAADAGPIEGAESGPFADGSFDFEAMLDFDFKTREIECQKCAMHCQVICVYRDKDIIDSWGNRCEKGAVKTTA